MSNSNFDFFGENHNVLAWLSTKYLTNMLKHIGNDTLNRISSETSFVPTIDEKIAPFCSDLRQLQEDYKEVRDLRMEESRLNDEISEAKEKLANEVSKKKKLIKLTVYMIIALIVGIGILILVLQF